MYLILRTLCDVQDGNLTACAVVPIDLETLEYWDTLRAESISIGARLDTTVTLSFENWAIDCFEYEPEGDEFKDQFLDSYLLSAAAPFPQDPPDSGQWSEEAPKELVYCEIHVSPKGLQWRFAVEDKYSLEEQTSWLTLADLDALQQALLVTHEDEPQTQRGA